MFEILKRYSRILVTGPQRSGTTICARMIAADTKHAFLAEEAFGVDDVERWQELVIGMSNAVLQCPSMCRYITHFGQYDDLAVVFMIRPVAEIVASQRRIQWKYEDDELQRYGRKHGPIAIVKYNYWGDYQKTQMLHVYEVEYHSLASHKLWVAKNERHNFNARQTGVVNEFD